MYSWRSGWPPASRWTEEYDFLLQSGSCVRRFFRPWLCTSLVGFLFSTLRTYDFMRHFRVVLPDRRSRRSFSFSSPWQFPLPLLSCPFAPSLLWRRIQIRLYVTGNFTF